MKELIGVIYFNYKISSIKRDILLFDKIGIPELKQEISWLKSLKNSESIQIANETEWMLDQGMLFDSSDYGVDWELLYDDAEVQKIYITVHQFLKKIQNRFPAGLSKNKKVLEEIENEFKKFSRVSIPYLVRIHSVNLRNVLNSETFPILNSMDLPPEFPCEATKKADVLDLVLKSLPMPDEFTPWEQILEFKKDSEYRQKFLALRSWMSKVARAKIPIGELEEELEYLLQSYQKYMELHKMKYKKGVLGAIVMTSADLIENLVKLKLSNITKSLFSIKHKKVNLMIEEMKAPGREVAYISSAKEIFRKKNYI